MLLDFHETIVQTSQKPSAFHSLKIGAVSAQQRLTK
jgi:hypothetical protein